jgi:hypothetical protein
VGNQKKTTYKYLGKIKRKNSMAGYSDQYLEQGSTFTSQLTLADAYGNPYNLTGFTVSSRAKKSYISSNVAIVFTTTITSANSGIVTLSLPSANTANVPYGKYVYDVIVNDGSTITRVLEGQVFVAPGVTGVYSSYGTDL